MRTIVVGAGASGLTCAITMARRGLDVTVLEKMDSSAKKILVTGNGRCNYWNEDFSNNNFYSSNSDFINKVNTLENRNEVINFFNSVGIVPYIKNGYYYPVSMQASSIRNLLLLECNRLGIKIDNNINVIDIKKEDDKFLVITSNGNYETDSVVLATGSYAYYKDKTNGYDLCKRLGHTIKPVLPSLVQLIGKDNYYKEWAGVRSNVKVSIYINDSFIKEEEGEIMLTDYGVSGICIFNLSGIANRSLYNKDRVKLLIDFFPQVKDMLSFLEEREKNISKRTIKEFFEGLINNKIIDVILNKCNINNNIDYSLLSLEEKKLLCNTIKRFDIDIVESKSFDNAQVCTGGVDTLEIDSNTMESLICKNLYIIGELLDVDGICGGYNLGFAWLSGTIAGRSVKND